MGNDGRNGDAVADRKTREDHSSNGRRKLLAMVHMGRKQLAMDEEAYRHILKSRFGVDSAKHLGARELSRLVAALEEMGAVFVGKGQQYGRSAMSRKASGAADRVTDAQIARIRKSWDAFARRKGFDSLEAWLRRYWKCERVDWLERGQASRVIAVLDGMAEEAELRAWSDGQTAAGAM